MRELGTPLGYISFSKKGFDEAVRCPTLAENSTAARPPAIGQYLPPELSFKLVVYREFFHARHPCLSR